MLKTKKHSTLSKIGLTVVLAGAAFVGINHFYEWFKDNYIAQTTAATAQEDLNAARNLLEADKAGAKPAAAEEEARRLLELIVADVHDPNITPDALILLAALNRNEAKNGEAAAALERACREYPTSPHYPKAAVAYADLLQEKGKDNEASRLYQEVCANAPPEWRAPALIGLGRQAEAKPDLLQAREYYQSASTDAPWDSDTWRNAVEALGRANVTLIFAPAQTPESKRHTVQKGDSITSIGNALNTTQGMLMRANGIDEKTILNLGQQLKYTPKDFRIVIERATCRLFLFDKEGLFKCYPVGLGKPGHEITLGSYKIGNKIKDPVWHKPGEGPIPAGDPTNELGTRWMPLVPEQEGLPKDLGIHGTIRPETIGFYSSMGCARMFPEDIEELYDLVVRSTPVDIVETYAGGVPQSVVRSPEPVDKDSSLQPTDSELQTTDS